MKSYVDLAKEALQHAELCDGRAETTPEMGEAEQQRQRSLYFVQLAQVYATLQVHATLATKVIVAFH